MNKMQKIATIVGIMLGSLVVLFLYVPWAPIYHVDNLDRLQRALPELDENSLVVFDIDDVLVTNADAWEREYFPKRSTDSTMLSIYNLKSDLNARVDRVKRDHLWQTYMSAFPGTLLAHDAPQLIKKLQEKGVKVIALTGIWVNAHDQFVEDMRIKSLAELGIDFAQSFTAYDGVSLTACNFEGKSPIFKGGIIFTALACNSKGDVLKEFIKLIGWVPKRVIAIDDKRNNLDSLYEVLNQMKIAYEGLLYTAASNLPAFYDKAAAELQLRYAIDQGTWLTAPQAREIIDAQVKKEAGCRCAACS